jgi:enoyl-CoA hydratase
MAELITRREGATGWIVFSNPTKHNALTYEMWRGVPEAVAQLERDSAVRVIALRGDGDKAFISGSDISEFGGMRDSIGATASYNQVVDSANAALLNAQKPTLACIQGVCIGGGLEIAIHCDLRICSDKAMFSMVAARLGMCYSYASALRLAEVVGQAYCAEFVFTARRYSAAEVLHMRLVNRVVPRAEFDKVVAEYCASVSENAPLTIAATKRTLIEGHKDRAERDIRTVQTMIDACFGSDDYREGRAAFLEKRKPVFRGR